MWVNNSMKRFINIAMFFGDVRSCVSTMYDIFGTGRDIKKYLHRIVYPSDFPISISCTLNKRCTFPAGSSHAHTCNS